MKAVPYVLIVFPILNYNVSIYIIINVSWIGQREETSALFAQVKSINLVYIAINVGKNKKILF
jgi:hypothetical protein